MVCPPPSEKSVWQKFKGLFISNPKQLSTKEEYELSLNAYLSSLITPEQYQSDGHRSAAFIYRTIEVMRKLHDQAFSNDYNLNYKYNFKEWQKEQVVDSHKFISFLVLSS